MFAVRGTIVFRMSGLCRARGRDASAVRMAIDRGENFHGYIPTESLGFIIRNYRPPAALGILETPCLDAHVHASNFNAQGVLVVEAVFDACDRDRLLALKPLGDAIALAESRWLTLFRGCAGPAQMSSAPCGTPERRLLISLVAMLQQLVAVATAGLS
jgi:hypothetical protein